MTGGIKTFSTPFNNIVTLHEQGSLAGKVRGITVLIWNSAGRCLIEVESQEEGRDQGLVKVFPQCVYDNVFRAVFQTLFHAFTPFSPRCLFPPTFSASPCILFLTQRTNNLSRRGPQGVTWCTALLSVTIQSVIIFISSLGLRSKTGWLRLTVYSHRGVGGGGVLSTSLSFYPTSLLSSFLHPCTCGCSRPSSGLLPWGLEWRSPIERTSRLASIFMLSALLQWFFFVCLDKAGVLSYEIYYLGTCLTN